MSIEHPSWNRAMTELNAAREALQQATETYKAAKHEAKERIDAAVSVLGVTLPDELTLQAATDLYWLHEDISVAVIADALGFDHYLAMLSKIGKAYVNKCSRCDNPIYLTSRSDMRSARNSHSAPLCDDCRKADLERYDVQRQAQQQVRENLRTMPYRQYLKTAHWEDMRKAALKRAGYSCQMCNTSGVELHVHHRTYERRGDERASDLIVLCDHCHAKFHDKLPVEEGE